MAETETKYSRVMVHLTEQEVRNLKASHPKCRNAESAVMAAIQASISSEGRVEVPESALREIATLAQMPRVTSADELLEAVRRIGNLREGQIVVSIDPALTPMLYEVARSSNLTLGEVASNYFAYGINAGWFNQFLETWAVNFSQKEYARLKQEMGAEGRPSGRDLVAFIVALRMSKDRAEELSAKVLPSAAATPVPEGSHADI
jgi:hypothetical protein